MFDKLYGMMNWPLIEGIEYTDIDNPSDLLGQHVIEDGLLIQSFVPDADKVSVKYAGKLYEMYKMDDDGFYATILDSDKTVKYKLEIEKDGKTTEVYDAYSFYLPDRMSDYKKFNAGIAYDAYEFMGAHHVTVSGVDGVRFAVWAPNALRVSLVGDFNNWDGRIYQMTKVADTGIFEIFVPELKAGSLYKFEIKKKGGENILKSDPYSFEIEKQEDGASIVPEKNDFKWSDVSWLKKRNGYNPAAEPVSIYQIGSGDFMTDEKSTYRDIAKKLSDYVTKMGYTHVEFLPIVRAVEDNDTYIPDFMYVMDDKFGTKEDFMYMIDYLHSKGIGVILDWTPTSFANSLNGLSYFDGSCLYESENPKRAINPRTGAHMFNYGRAEVTNYLLANAFMLIDSYHIDGLNIVNIPEMLYHDYNRNPGEWESNIYGGTQNLEAIEFLKHFNSIIHKLREGVITITDDNSGFPDMTGVVSEECIGFDLKFNNEWKNDFLGYMAVPAYLRESRYNELSLSMVYQYSDNFVVGFNSKEFANGNQSMISRMAGETEERKFNNMKLAISYEYVHPGKKLIFAGQDMATYEEWNKEKPLNFDILEEDKFKNINNLVKELNKLYAGEKALFELDNDAEGFEWINNISARESVLTFVRRGKNPDDMLLVACNFDAVDRSDYKIGVPLRGKYKEIFNSDSKNFGGNGFVNPRLKQSKTDECDGREESVRVNLAGLSVSVFKFSKADVKLADNKTAKANTKTVTKKAAETKDTKKEPVKKPTTRKKASAKKTVDKKDTVKPEVTTEVKPELPKKEAAKTVTVKKEATVKKTSAVKKTEAKKTVKETKNKTAK